MLVFGGEVEAAGASFLAHPICLLSLISGKGWKFPISNPVERRQIKPDFVKKRRIMSEISADRLHRLLKNAPSPCYYMQRISKNEVRVYGTRISEKCKTDRKCL